MNLTLANFAYPISNVIVPQNGPKTVPAVADFSNAGQLILMGRRLLTRMGLNTFRASLLTTRQCGCFHAHLCGNTGSPHCLPPKFAGLLSSASSKVPRFTATMAQAGGRVNRAIL
jgi:hypothetical protein